MSYSYSSYKSRHTVKDFTCVAPYGAVVFTVVFPASTSDAAIVDHCSVSGPHEPSFVIRSLVRLLDSPPLLHKMRKNEN